MLTLTDSTVNGVVIRTADLNDWDDCPRCVYGQVHLVGTAFECIEPRCTFRSASTL